MSCVSSLFKRWVCITWLGLAISVAHAQSYYFKHYHVENGLSNNTVFCSMQDRNGFLWFGTKEGLNRFDGYRFKLFKSDNGDEHKINRDFTYCLFSDPNGILWVGTQNGIYRMDALHEQMVRLIDTIYDVNAIQMDRRGRLWFISGQTVCRYDLVTKTVKVFPVDRYFKATTLCLSQEGDMWFATDEGFLYRFNDETEAFKAYKLIMRQTPGGRCFIKKLHAAGRGALFIGTSCHGIKLFDISAGTVTNLLTLNPDKTTIYVRDILQYSIQEYWFATESGIFIYNVQTHRFTNLRKKFLDPYSISDNAVYTLCKDQEGGVWAGTFFGGVNYYPKQYTPFHKYYPDGTANTISGNAVREICEDHAGNLWIGTEDAGLNKYNRHTGAITHYMPTGAPGSIAYYNVHGLLVTGNELWIGTHEHGMDRMNITTGRVIKHYAAGTGPYDFTNNFVVTFLQSRRGDIYVGTGQGLYRYLKEKDGFERITAIPANEFVSCLAEDHEGSIWVGTHRRGAIYFNPVTGRQGEFINDPTNTNSLSFCDINAVYEDSYHNIWVATEGGGLSMIDSQRQQVTRFTTREGLPSNFIFKVLEDNDKNIWASSSKGLVKLAPFGKTMELYTKANGLLYDQFNYNSGFKDSQGVLYIGCIKGMISFNPHNFSTNTYTPPVYITGFQVHNRELDINTNKSPLRQSILFTDGITLQYNQSSFSIDFAALGYATPEITTYKYKMEGLDKDWICLHSNRKVYFTNLSAGHYIFKLNAAVNGRWGHEKQIAVTILPPFWASTWAKLLYTLVLATAIYTLVRNYHRRQKVKKEKEIYEAKFNFFTNVAHEIRTPLTLIKGPVENLMEKVNEWPDIQDDVFTMERNTNRLMTLITQILDFRQTEAKGFSIDFTRVNITALLQEVYDSFQPLAKKRNLQFNIILPTTQVTAMADEDALFKILSNLFSNAIKYADKQIEVQLHPVQKDDATFTIEMWNDGHIIPSALRERIFEPFFRIKETIRQKGTGIGLALARSLTQLHRGALYVKEGAVGVNTFVLCLPLQPVSNGNGHAIKKSKPAKNKLL